MAQSLLTRRIAEIIDKKHLEERLRTSEKLRVKLGIDPSKPELHIGHAVTLGKLREFQDAGHTAVLIIGDYTAQLGDPTDRSEARKILSAEEVKANAEGYLDQAYIILDETKTEVHYQSEWFGDFNLRQVMELMASTTVNNLLSHETFGKRLAEGTPLHFHELLYPLLQGYDSVMVKADVELGGIDQKFNVLMGRTIQRAFHQPEQDVVLLQYLPGTDGQAKMSKSLGNTINLTDPAEEMFGKVMSIPDSLIVPYFELATQLPEPTIREWQTQLDQKTINPKEAKVKLAKQIVSEYYNSDVAQAAAETFDKTFRQKQAPDAIETLRLPRGAYDLVELLTNQIALVPSKSEARRLIAQRGVKINQKTVEDPTSEVTPADGETVTIQVGPRRWVKIEWKK